MLRKTTQGRQSLPSHDYCMAAEASQKAESHPGLYSAVSGWKHSKLSCSGGGWSRVWTVPPVPPTSHYCSQHNPQSLFQPMPEEAEGRGTVGRSPGKQTCRSLTDFQFIQHLRQNSSQPPSKHWNQNDHTVLKTFENIISALKDKTKQILKVSNTKSF